jgi:hypothetical protein
MYLPLSAAGALTTNVTNDCIWYQIRPQRLADGLLPAGFVRSADDRDRFGAPGEEAPGDEAPHGLSRRPRIILTRPCIHHRNVLVGIRSFSLP